MQSTVASLLLVTSAVALACFTVNYSVVIAEQYIQVQNGPLFDRLNNLQEYVLNQTDSMFDQTQIPMPSNTTKVNITNEP